MHATRTAGSMGRVALYPGCRDERYPGVSSWESLEHIGPMSRTVADSALMLNVIAGPDPRDRYSIPAADYDYVEATKGDIKGLRIAYSEDWPPTGYDFWMPLLSAPYHFQSELAPALYAELPYLHADPALCQQWAPRLPSRGLRVGLLWQGNPKFEFDSTRSLPGLELLQPLWEIGDVAFISLQKGVGEEQAVQWAAGHPLTCLGQHMEDFADAAAIVAQLDLVISVDSAIAHLAAALGTPCWVLLPDYMCDWRWGVAGDETAWYPGVMRLFRQGVEARWEPVVERVRQALQARRLERPA